MSPVDQDAVVYALGMIEQDAKRPQPDRVFTLSWLLTVMKDNGYTVGKTVASEHLRRVCACEQAV